MPLATTEKLAVPPGETVALTGAVAIAAPFCTVRVKDWVAAGATVLLACRVNEKGEPVLFVGVPLITPVVALSEAHGGKVPAVTLKVGAGEPVAVAVNVPAVLTEKLVVAALVIVGACCTVRTAGVVEETAPPTPFVTVARNWSLLIASETFATVSVAVPTPL